MRRFNISDVLHMVLTVIVSDKCVYKSMLVYKHQSVFSVSVWLENQISSSAERLHDDSVFSF